jgi:hypothetical protein
MTNYIGGYTLLGSAASTVDRWATPVHGGIATTSQTFTAGRVVMAQFALTATRTVDAISYIVGSTSNGNVRAGIIGPVALTADTAQDSAVAVQSASVAQGTANQAQLIALPATVLRAGIYYVALQGDSATGTYMRQANQAQAPGLAQIYDRSGGYGAFTEPTPAVTDTGSGVPGLRVRLA